MYFSKGSGRYGLYLVITPTRISHYFIAVPLDFAKPDFDQNEMYFLYFCHSKLSTLFKEDFSCHLFYKSFYNLKSGESNFLKFYILYHSLLILIIHSFIIAYIKLAINEAHNNEQKKRVSTPMSHFVMLIMEQLYSIINYLVL